jgi:hypothetical protein
MFKIYLYLFKKIKKIFLYKYNLGFFIDIFLLFLNLKINIIGILTIILLSIIYFLARKMDILIIL